MFRDLIRFRRFHKSIVFSRFSAIFKLIFASNCISRDHKIASLDFIFYFWSNLLPSSPVISFFGCLGYFLATFYLLNLVFFCYLITLYTEYTLVMYLALKQFIAIISCHDSDVKHLSRSHKNSVPMWFDEILRCASPPPDGASELPIAAPPGHLAARHGSCLPLRSRKIFQIKQSDKNRDRSSKNVP